MLVTMSATPVPPRRAHRRFPSSTRRVLPAAALALALSVGGCSSESTSTGSKGGASGSSTPLGSLPEGTDGRPARVVAAGDVACPPALRADIEASGTTDQCQDLATAATVRDLAPQAVLALGDLQYDRGAIADFRDSYDTTWGAFKDLTRPVPGNHEYETRDGAGYYEYFGDAVRGPDGRGWYSFDLGGWHLVALNSNCDAVGGCGPDSPQGRWLAADLAAHAETRCSIAYWHHPRYSSGAVHGDDESVAPLWDAVSAAGVDLVLVGHVHNYERFEPMGTDGSPSATGPVQVVVGSGGKSHYPFTETPRAGSVARDASTYGVLELTLGTDAADLRYVASVGGSFTDRATVACR